MSNHLFFPLVTVAECAVEVAEREAVLHVGDRKRAHRIRHEVRIFAPVLHFRILPCFRTPVPDVEVSVLLEVGTLELGPAGNLVGLAVSLCVDAAIAKMGALESEKNSVTKSQALKSLITSLNSSL